MFTRVLTLLLFLSLCSSAIADRIDVYQVAKGIWYLGKRVVVVASYRVPGVMVATNHAEDFDPLNFDPEKSLVGSNITHAFFSTAGTYNSMIIGGDTYSIRGSLYLTVDLGTAELRITVDNTLGPIVDGIGTISFVVTDKKKGEEQSSAMLTIKWPDLTFSGIGADLLSIDPLKPFQEFIRPYRLDRGKLYSGDSPVVTKTIGFQPPAPTSPCIGDEDIIYLNKSQLSEIKSLLSENKNQGEATRYLKQILSKNKRRKNPTESSLVLDLNPHTALLFSKDDNGSKGTLKTIKPLNRRGADGTPQICVVEESAIK